MKPILFNTEMVRATLEDRKTATRRVVKAFSATKGVKIYKTACGEFYAEVNEMPTDFQLHPPYLPGDILYVRETWSTTPNGQDYLFRADADGNVVKGPDGKWYQPKWRPSIYMPKEAARIFLRVTDVRVERLQDIDGSGIKAEGTDGRFGATRGAFMNLWNSTVKRSERDRFGWTANPWVWVIEFERISREEAETWESKEREMLI